MHSALTSLEKIEKQIVQEMATTQFRCFRVSHFKCPVHVNKATHGWVPCYKYSLKILNTGFG